VEATGRARLVPVTQAFGGGEGAVIRILTLASLASAVAFASVVLADPADRKEDLYGDWDLVGMVYRGVVQDPADLKGGTIRIEKGKLFLRYKEFPQPVELGFEIRPGAGTGEVDELIDSTRFLGRYELKDGALRIVLALHANKPRPAGFDAEKDEGVLMYVLRRPKK
jgi:hypothetical protein